MRTRTAQDDAFLFAGFSARASTWIKVELEPKGGSFFDITDLFGHDFVRSVQYSAALDVPAATATVTLAAWLGNPTRFALSPLIATSTINSSLGVLCQIDNRIRISTAKVPYGAPRPSSFNEVFLGRIDRFSQRSGELVLECRDQAGKLQDTFIKSERLYGAQVPATATAADLEEVIQNILDDNINTTASAPRTSALASRTTDGDPYQLYSVNGDSTTPFNLSTNAATLEYMQSKQTVWEALQACADTIQYNLRFRFHEGSGVNAFVLVLENPDRTKTTADVTFDPLQNQCKIESLSLAVEYIRNSVSVTYYLNGVTPVTLLVADSASIAKYGERYMEYNPSSSSQVTSAATASTLASAILAELKEPLTTAEIMLPYIHWLDLNDLVAIGADNVHTDTVQKLAVLSLEHAIEQGGAAVTRANLRGVPKRGAVQTINNTRLYRSYDRTFDRLRATKAAAGRLANAAFGSATNT